MKIARTLLCAVFFTLLPVVLFAQWQPAVQLSADTAAALNENMGQCLAVSGDSVHVVWEDFNVDSGAVFYRHSFDGGVTWGTIQRLTNLPSVAAFPSIAVFGNTVHVAYRDTRDTTYVSYYLRSLDGGNTWDPPVSLGNYYWWPSITCTGNLVCVALNSNEPGNSEVWFRRSTDNGTSWDSVVRISNAIGRSEDPSIAAGGGYVHLAWNDDRLDTAGNMLQTWYRRSSDNGVTWGPETELTFSPVECYAPILHVADSNVDLAYMDRRSGDYEIYFKESPNFGSTWDSSVQISQFDGNVGYPNIARAGQNIYLTWFEFGGVVALDHSSDGGTTWDSIDTLVSAAYTPRNPFIVSSDSMLHTIWTDQRDGYHSIYYMHDSIGNPISTGGGARVNVNNSTPSFLDITPNPATTNATLRVNSATPLEDVKLNFYDAAARLIATQNIGSIAEGAQSIPLSLLPMDGVVFVRVTSGGVLVGTVAVAMMR